SPGPGGRGRGGPGTAGAGHRAGGGGGLPGSVPGLRGPGGRGGPPGRGRGDGAPDRAAVRPGRRDGGGAPGGPNPPGGGHHGVARGPLERGGRANPDGHRGGVVTVSRRGRLAPGPGRSQGRWLVLGGGGPAARW